MRSHNLILKCFARVLPERSTLLDYVRSQLRDPVVKCYENVMEDESGNDIELAPEKEDEAFIRIRFNHPLDLSAGYAVEIAKEAIKQNMIYCISCYGRVIDILLY